MTGLLTANMAPLMFAALVIFLLLGYPVAFSLAANGLFFGIVARRGTVPELGADPVPQALVITGIVVAFSATALAVALLLRLFEATGSATLRADAATKAGNAPADA